MYQPFKFIFSVFVLLLAFGSSSYAQDANIDLGQKLFRTNCGQCHNRDMKTDLTGPALGPSLEDWAEYPAEDLRAWVRNSQELISEGHPLAVEIWHEWKPSVMPPNPNMTDRKSTRLNSSHVAI